METAPRDSELVRQAQAGDKQALGFLFTRHRSLAWRLAVRLLGDAGEAEDVAQEACLQAMLGLDRLRQPERFGSWLAGIALNVARMRLRGRRYEVDWEEADGGGLVSGLTVSELLPSVEDLAEIRALQAAILAAIETLPAEQRSAVRWYYLDGLTLSEIAALSGAPLGTVKVRLFRARERLRARLAEPAALPDLEETLMIEMVIDDVLLRVPQTGPNQPADVLAAAGREAVSPGAEPVRIPLPPPGPAQFVAVLKERAGGRVLPIWIGPHEAQLIKWQLAGGSAPRPLTYELMARLLEAAGARVERVTISRLEADIFYATVHLAAPAAVTVDARPSDALALAQRLHAPIFVDASVLTQAGVTAEALPAHLDATARMWAAGGSGAEPPPPVTVEWRWVSAPTPDFNLRRPTDQK